MFARFEARDRDQATQSIASRYVAGTIEIACPAGQALLLVPLHGEWVVPGAVQRRCATGDALLWSRHEPLRATGSERASGLLLNLDREQLNAAASAAFGDGRRLAQAAIILGGGDLAAALDALARRLPYAADTICRAIVGTILARCDARTVLAPVRAVSEAMQLVRDDPGGSHDIERLATRVGVTAQTLRKGFRACLGLTVAEFVATVRLDWAHGRLASGRESSSVAVLARLAGFADSSHFARGYARRFGETPSQTRMRAVQMAA